MRVALVLMLMTSPAWAVEMRVARDLPYAEPKSERNTLDIYSADDGTAAVKPRRPVIVWIHGGGWRRGDKAVMDHKPQAYVDRGFVFAAINYRFYPDVTIQQMMGDVAKAIGWVHGHVREYGGDPERLIVMGHSAGAHLAALVCTDERYLKFEGLPLATIKGCVPLDVAALDIPKRMADSPDTSGNFVALFGATTEAQQQASPVTFVAPNKNIPPFLILHITSRRETTEQSQWFAEKLKAAGVPATVVSCEGKTHATLNSDLGQPEDAPTLAIDQFLDTVLVKK